MCGSPPILDNQNKVEYEALLTSLDLAKVVRDSSVVIHSDSKVIIGHVNEDYEDKRE